MAVITVPTFDIRFRLLNIELRLTWFNGMTHARTHAHTHKIETPCNTTQRIHKAD